MSQRLRSFASFRKLCANGVPAILLAASLMGLGGVAHAVTKGGLGDVAPTAGPTAPCSAGVVYCPKTTDDGYVYGYDATTKAVVRIPGANAGTPTPHVTYRYTLTPACSASGPFSDATCAGAGSFCASVGKTGLHEYVWRTSEESNFKQWTIVGDLCTGGLPNPISTQQVTTDVSEYERDHMPVVKPTVQPPGAALVNLPVLVSVQDPGPQTMSVQLPVPGQLTATPTFTWTFDDGAVLQGAGKPYVKTVDPRTDTANYYLSHTYRAAETRASVTLVVTWHATFAAAGQTFTLPDLQMPPITTTYPVYEAKSVLVDGTATP